jgi:hypothetical protein
MTDLGTLNGAVKRPCLSTSTLQPTQFSIQPQIFPRVFQFERRSTLRGDRELPEEIA